MTPAILLAVYCALIIVASLAGGWIPLLVRLTHRRMEIALSFVSGIMLGVAFLHLLPHAISERAAWRAEKGGAAAHDHDATGALALSHEVVDPVLLWVLAGFLAMFMIERYFCFHHHDAPEGGSERADPAGHRHALTWGGAAIGLTLHTLIAGMALAASVQTETRASGGAALAGFGTFLMIVLHKPFDALTIGTLMAVGNRSRGARHALNALFSLAIPVGAMLFLLPLSSAASYPHAFVCVALAFATGTFLCIALSDLLPELQFHQHDRLVLSVALVLGLGLAWAVRLLEH